MTVLHLSQSELQAAVCVHRYPASFAQHREGLLASGSGLSLHIDRDAKRRGSGAGQTRALHLLCWSSAEAQERVSEPLGFQKRVLNRTELKSHRVRIALLREKHTDVLHPGFELYRGPSTASNVYIFTMNIWVNMY